MEQTIYPEQNKAKKATQFKIPNNFVTFLLHQTPNFELWIRNLTMEKNLSVPNFYKQYSHVFLITTLQVILSKHHQMLKVDLPLNLSITTYVYTYLKRVCSEHFWIKTKKTGANFLSSKLFNDGMITSSLSF